VKLWCYYMSIGKEDIYSCNICRGPKPEVNGCTFFNCCVLVHEYRGDQYIMPEPTFYDLLNQFIQLHMHSGIQQKRRTYHE
jgi:hypothetical protein